MLMRKKWLMVVYCFLLSFMVVTVGIKSVAAKEKKAKFNKQYSGKVDGYHSTTYELKVPDRARADQGETIRLRRSCLPAPVR